MKVKIWFGEILFFESSKAGTIVTSVEKIRDGVLSIIIRLHTDHNYEIFNQTVHCKEYPRVEFYD